MGLTPVGALVEEILDPTQLAIAADERGLETVRLERAAGCRDDAQSLPERQRLLFPLQRVRADVLVGDRLLGHPASRPADQHRPGFGSRLNP